MSLLGIQSRIILSISNRENLIQEFGYRVLEGLKKQEKEVKGGERNYHKNKTRETMVGNYAGQYSSLGIWRNIPYITLQMFG